MARYQMLVKVDKGVYLQWYQKPDGSRYSTNERDITFIVDTDYPDRTNVREILKSTGGSILPNCGCPGGDIRDNVNGWHLQLLKKY